MKVEAKVGSKSKDVRPSMGQGVKCQIAGLLQKAGSIVWNGIESNFFCLPNKLAKPLGKNF